MKSFEVKSNAGLSLLNVNAQNEVVLISKDLLCRPLLFHKYKRTEVPFTQQNKGKRVMELDGQNELRACTPFVHDSHFLILLTYIKSTGHRAILLLSNKAQQVLPLPFGCLMKPLRKLPENSSRLWDLFILKWNPEHKWIPLRIRNHIIHYSMERIQLV